MHGQNAMQTLGLGRAAGDATMAQQQLPAQRPQQPPQQQRPDAVYNSGSPANREPPQLQQRGAGGAGGAGVAGGAGDAYGQSPAQRQGRPQSAARGMPQ